MNEIEPENALFASRSSRTGLWEFESGLRKAEDFLRQDDLKSAFALLSELETCYLQGAQVFLLLGEVFHRRGQTAQASRYKTLYDVLKANFGIIEKGISPDRTSDSLEFHGQTEPFNSLSRVSLDEPHTEVDTSQEFVPLTAAMAEELMRQGHYSKALEIYDRLLARDPQNAELSEARNAAKKKSREDRVLGVFELWLRNIQRMKGELTGKV